MRFSTKRSLALCVTGDAQVPLARSIGCRSRLTPAHWDRLEDALAADSFWTLDSTETPRPMLDGSDCTIRGCQAAGRITSDDDVPYDPIRDLFELFMELAGSEAINGYFEYPATFPVRP
jgi:hypothetical protein